MRKLNFIIAAISLLLLALVGACTKTPEVLVEPPPVAPAEISCVKLLSPTNGATNITGAMLFQWASTCPKDSFRLLLTLPLEPFYSVRDSTLISYADTLVNIVTKNKFYNFTPLYPLHNDFTYNWKVKNLNQKDTSVWSETFTFSPPDERDTLIGTYYNIERTRFTYNYPITRRYYAGTGSIKISKHPTLNGGLQVEEVGNPQSITALDKGNSEGFYDLYPNGQIVARGKSYSEFYLGTRRDSFSVCVVTKRDPGAFQVEGYYFNGRFR